MRIILQLSVSLLGVLVANHQCATQQQNDKPLVTLFDNNLISMDKGLWPNLCAAIEKFPKGLISMDYRPGSWAEGNAVDNLKCPVTGDCNNEFLRGCELLKDIKINDCFSTNDSGDEMYMKEINCFCKRESFQLIMENAKLRKQLKIPDDGYPTLAFNGIYYPNVPIGSVEEIQNQLCVLYQLQVQPCI